MMKKIALLSVFSLFAVTFFAQAEVVTRGGKHCEKDSFEKCCETIKKTLCELDRGTNKINCKLDNIKEILCWIVGLEEYDLEVDWITLCHLASKIDTLQTTVNGMASQLDAIYNGTQCVRECPAD